MTQLAKLTKAPRSSAFLIGWQLGALATHIDVVPPSAGRGMGEYQTALLADGLQQLLAHFKLSDHLHNKLDRLAEERTADRCLAVRDAVLNEVLLTPMLRDCIEGGILLGTDVFQKKATAAEEEQERRFLLAGFSPRDNPIEAAARKIGGPDRYLEVASAIHRYREAPTKKGDWQQNFARFLDAEDEARKAQRRKELSEMKKSPTTNNFYGNVYGAVGDFAKVVNNLQAGDEPRRQLADALNNARQALAESPQPEDAKQEQLEVLARVGEEASREKPSKLALQSMSDGLKSAASAIPSITAAVTAVTDLIGKISS